MQYYASPGRWWGNGRLRYEKQEVPLPDSCCVFIDAGHVIENALFLFDT